MKKLLVVSMCFFVLACSKEKQNNESFVIINNNIFYKESDSSRVDAYSYFKGSKKIDSREKLIQELFKFKGNQRTSKPFILRYNNNLSQFYHGSIKETSVEIEALILINQLYFDNFSYYSPYPILIDKKSGKEINNDSIEMKQVFHIYQKWFKKVKKQGFENARVNKILPLDQSQYKWIYGININPKDDRTD